MISGVGARPFFASGGGILIYVFFNMNRLDFDIPSLNQDLFLIIFF